MQPFTLISLYRIRNGFRSQIIFNSSYKYFYVYTIFNESYITHNISESLNNNYYTVNGTNFDINYFCNIMIKNELCRDVMINKNSILYTFNNNVKLKIYKIDDNIKLDLIHHDGRIITHSDKYYINNP